MRIEKRARSHDGVLVLSPPMGRRIAFMLTGIFLLSAIPYALYRMVAHPQDDARARAESVLPTWVEWPVLVVLTLVGLFGLLYSWRARTWVAPDWISHRGFLGNCRTLHLGDLTRIRTKARGSVVSSTLPSLHVFLDRDDGPRGRYTIFLSSDFVPLAPVLRTLREWSLRRPTLVTDEETGRALGVTPYVQP